MMEAGEDGGRVTVCVAVELVSCVYPQISTTP